MGARSRVAGNTLETIKEDGILGSSQAGGAVGSDAAPVFEGEEAGTAAELAAASAAAGAEGDSLDAMLAAQSAGGLAGLELSAPGGAGGKSR